MIRALALFLGLTLPAAAHEWYAWNCCHDRDCRPLPDGAVEEYVEGDRSFYVVSIPGRGEPVLMEQSDPRVKQVPIGHDDGQTFHICTTAGAPDTMVLCLYVPGRGV